jgi:hypothetical protein
MNLLVWHVRVNEINIVQHTHVFFSHRFSTSSPWNTIGSRGRETCAQPLSNWKHLKVGWRFKYARGAAGTPGGCHVSSTSDVRLVSQCHNYRRYFLCKNQTVAYLCIAVHAIWQLLRCFLWAHRSVFFCACGFLFSKLRTVNSFCKRGVFILKI